MADVRVRLGRFGRAGVDGLLAAASGIAGLPERIDFISAAFLGVPYGASTLSAREEDEALVIDLSAVDCFTYLDYVEAMRASRSYDDLAARLVEVRYRSGVVAYRSRNHFFTDWAASGRVDDATAKVGGREARTAPKLLNGRADGTAIIMGIAPVERAVAFIPASRIGPAASMLRTGDYAGVYAEEAGLDVSHVGIVIRHGGELLLRHASSVKEAVVEEDFGAYMASKPGLVVLRPRPWRAPRQAPR